MEKKIFLINRLFVCLSLLLLFSCGGRIDNIGSQTHQDIELLSCVVLLPTIIPYDESVIDPGQRENLRHGADFIDRTLRNLLEKSQISRVINPGGLHQQFDEISGGKSGVIKGIGERTGCDTVLVTYLNKFKQRQGGEYAVDAAASTAFDLRLVVTDSGHSLWNATFNETQSSLLSNLFAYGKAKSRGFKWITVEELAAQGVEEKLKGCPYLF